MIEKAVLITDVTNVAGAKDIQYHDGDKDYTKKVFESVPGWNLLEANKMVKLTFEKSAKGYWNITKVEPGPVPTAKEPLPPIQPHQEATKSPQGGTTDTKQASNYDTGRNRAFALSYAKDIAVARITKGMDVNGRQVLDLAGIFLKWLDTGEIPEIDVKTPIKAEQK